MYVSGKTTQEISDVNHLACAAFTIIIFILTVFATAAVVVIITVTIVSTSSSNYSRSLFLNSAIQ